jgi:lipopolysaccharide transport system permease protein
MATSETLPKPAGPAPATKPDKLRVRVIEPRRPGLFAPVREGWRRRRMLPFFALKTLQKTYNRTWLGVLWLPLRPGIDLILKIGVIGTLIGSPAPGVPYLLFAMVGMSVWELFEKAAFWGTRSLESSRRQLKQAYFARLPIITGGLAPASVFFGMYAIATVGVIIYFWITDGTTHLTIGLSTFAVPAGLALLALFGLTVALFLAPVALYARDVRFLLGYALGFWFYLTPVLYPPDKVTGLLEVAVTVNPISAPVGLVGHGLLGTPMPSTASVAFTVVGLVVLIPIGLLFFGRAERASAEAR